MTQPVPVLGISGYSGSGKTSLIVHLVRQLTAQGLLVGVLKHSHHPLEGPSERDTTLFTEAGATAVLGVNDDGAALVRRTPWLIDPLAGLPPDLDLILVEGFKAAPIPKLWIDHRRPPPPEAEAWVIPTRSAMAPEEYTSRVVEWLAQRWALRPLRLGLLVGGGSTRMGRPKALMVIDGQPLALKLGHELGLFTDGVTLLGTPPEGLPATFPTLPDAPGVAGPLAGILAALRWDPSAAWLMLGCDFPHFGPVALRWLLEHRRPGVWGVLPVLRANSLPVAAIYEPMLLPLLEAQLAAGETSPKAILMGIAKVAQQIVPFELETAFRSFNTPEEWAALVSSDPGSDR